MINAKRNERKLAPFFALAILLLVSLACGNTITPPSSGKSPDGRFQAQYTSTDNKSTVYEVTEIETGKLILTTYSEYPDTSNDVKAAIFSTDSKKFAVAYHYSHQGNYTWVGIWSTETGEFLYSKQLEGFVTNLDNVFDN